MVVSSSLYLSFVFQNSRFKKVILNVVSDIAAFYYMITRNLPLPQPSWQLGKSYYAGNISLTPSAPVSNPVLIKASTYKAALVQGD